METLRTNSDLYLTVVALGESDLAKQRSLDEYLRAFWSAGYDYCDAEELTLSEFVELVTRALDGPAPPFERYWAREDLSVTDGDDPFTVWARTLRAQICDLRELTAAGLYENSNRYLGVRAPRPHGVDRRPIPERWCNFDITSYLECGVEGSFGGWRPEFDGALVDTEPGDSRPLDRLTWTDLTRFTVCGQSYE